MFQCDCSTGLRRLLLAVNAFDLTAITVAELSRFIIEALDISEPTGQVHVSESQQQQTVLQIDPSDGVNSQS